MIKLKFHYVLKTYLSSHVRDVIIVGGGPSGLLLSLILRKYGIRNTIIEKRLKPTSHPQAHYINCRSMEIFRCFFPKLHQRIIESASDSSSWRDYSYCYSVLGRQYARIDHFEDPSVELLKQSSPTSVIHLPQNILENLLREEIYQATLEDDMIDSYFGYEVVKMSNNSHGSQIKIQSIEHSSGISNKLRNMSAKFLIAADGANSYIRNQLGINMAGTPEIQSLMNIHFTCVGLHKHLKPRPAMLYFVYNENVICVFVAHFPDKDIWVCQIPIFPPHQTISSYNENDLIAMIKYGLGINHINELHVRILSTGMWKMDALVAETYSNQYSNVFLVGDSAHRFPPSGGFGMNTGLQDVHNLAWKLSWVIQNQAHSSLLSTYDIERRKIGLENTQFSLRNYDKTLTVARLLGVDPEIAKAVHGLSRSRFVPPFVGDQVFKLAFNVGLSTLRLLNSGIDFRVSLVKNFVERDRKGLSMIFPEEDLGFGYHEGIANRKESTGSRLNRSPLNRLREGHRLPHVWLAVRDQPIGSARESSLVNGIDNETKLITVISTVDLTVLCVCYTGCNRERVDSQINSLPVITIISTELDYLSAFKLSLMKKNPSVLSLFAFVHIQTTSVHNIETTNQPCLSMSDIQNALQTPNYLPTHDYKKSNSITLLDIWNREDSHDSLLSSYPDDSFVQLVDITNEWKKMVSDSASESLSVVLRPDGHVARIKAGCFDEQTVDDVISYFRLLAK